MAKIEDVSFKAAAKFTVYSLIVGVAITGALALAIGAVAEQPMRYGVTGQGLMAVPAETQT